MKYVICVPDGCADDPFDALGGRTPLEVVAMPNLARLAGRIPRRLHAQASTADVGIADLT